MNYLLKRHNTYFARLRVPAKAQPILGRKEFQKTLQTASLKTAEIRKVALISKWKEEIAAAMDSDPIKADAMWWRNACLEASNDQTVLQLAEELLVDRASDIKDTLGLIESKRFHELATGQSIDLHDYLDSWHKYRLKEVSEKEADNNMRRAKRMADLFKQSSKVTRKGVLEWIDKQQEEIAVATVRKVIKACHFYWEYLQSRELVPEGQSPFDGHKIKPPAKQKLHKEMLAYTAPEVVKLHRVAVSKGKVNLSHTIRIGAYTGLRQDEICQLQVTDIIEVEGVKCISLRDSKTAAGLRTIPIADKLLPHIESLVQAAVERDDVYLLPGETIDRYGKRSRNGFTPICRTPS